MLPGLPTSELEGIRYTKSVADSPYTGAIRQALFPPTKHRSARPRLPSTSVGRLNPLAMWRTAHPGTTVGGSTRSEALGHDTNPRKDEHESERSEEKTPGSGAQRDLAETPAKFKMTIR
ncbi:hypothetical protein K4K52_005106 [Colletotrichum sp. SAR 10_76]|nr:hypothetical protein K4K52_005106 [Colletotrichum sp. SAR 10_76]